MLTGAAKKLSASLKRRSRKSRSTSSTAAAPKFVVFDFGSVIRVKPSGNYHSTFILPSPSPSPLAFVDAHAPASIERQEVEESLVVALREKLAQVGSKVRIESIDDVKKHVKKPNWSKVRAGKISRESAYVAAFAALGVEDKPFILDFIQRYDHAGKYILPMMWTLLGELRKDPRVVSVILSNHSKELAGVLREKKVVPQYIKAENVFISAITGIRKPNHGAYKNCLEKMKAEPHNMLFIDNKPENVQGARDCGINAILYSFDPKACGPQGQGDATCQQLREQIHKWIDSGALEV